MALDSQDIQVGKPRIDFSRYQLSVAGRQARLERQPMELLILFVQRKGHLVTREDIVQKLWGKDVFVDVDGSINSAVGKIRAALRDDPERPRYLETVIGKGYRFIGEIEVAGANPGTIEPPGAVAEAAPSPVAPRRRRHIMIVCGLVVILIAAAAWSWFRWRAQSGPQVSQIHSIAVLPLVNLSGDPAQEYFADGMTDELITEMAQVGSLRVISRTSAMHYKATTKTTPEIAKELNVDAVLEGSVARSGGRVRITAQLIEARADKHLWASSYEAEPKDVLGMQAAVARDVVKQIRLRLTTQEQERLSRSRPVNPEAYEAYLKGLYFWNKRDKTGLEKAIEYFNQAIAIDPNYAPPNAGVANSYVPLIYLGYVRGTEAQTKVTAALSKALELDESLAEAHTALGAAKSFYDYDWEGAEKEYRRAIELNPNYATAHLWYGQILGSEGRHEEALAEAKRALELDPLSLIINANWGGRLNRARRYDEAVAYLTGAALELDPNFSVTHWNLGMAYAAQKNFKAAIQELQKASLQGNIPALGALGYAYAASGDKGQAQAVLRRLENQASRQYVDPYAFALVYAGLNDKDKAFSWLEKAHEDRDGLIGHINEEPMLDGLRADPRFADLLRRIGLAH
jgi:TolB-like protein/DNA-binding winged helix-turn-helix (wHTH) protein/Tfp pilus assembly protein PilF